MVLVWLHFTMLGCITEGSFSSRGWLEFNIYEQKL
jgi:hypothetical protein